MKGGRINKNLTERIVILIPPEEMVKLKIMSCAEHKGVSEIGRDLIIQYNNEHRLDRIKYLERKAREESQ